MMSLSRSWREERWSLGHNDLVDIEVRTRGQQFREVSASVCVTVCVPGY